ncbi:Gfo/Idh/MocA family oxidoreductase [soil metagenome]
MESVKCALVGFGMIGVDHAQILHSIPESELLVICDLDASKAPGIPDGVAFTTSLDETLDWPGLEAVWVCTPQASHHEVVIAALDRGLSVFCEKPIADSLAHADAMIEAAARTGGLLAIGHTLRFDPNYIQVAEAVARGDLGQPIQLSARWNAPDFEGRIISGRTTVPLEQMIHDLDVMRWLVGDIVEIYAQASPVKVTGPGPDVVVATVLFESGAVASLDHSWIMPSATGVVSDHQLAVFGTEGVAYVDHRDTPTQIFGPTPRFINATYAADSNGVPTGALPSEDRYFLAMVRDGRSWPLALSDARAALVAGLAMDRSIVEHRPIRMDQMETGEF